MERTMRQNVAIEETWDLSDLFESELLFEEELESIGHDVQTVLAYQTKLGRNAETLLKAIKAMEAFKKRVSHVINYAMLNISADGTNTTNQARYAKTTSILTDINAALAFFEPELLTIPRTTLQRFLQDEPALLPYEKMLTDLMDKKPFTLAPDIEKVLAALGEVLDAPYKIYNQSKSADLSFASIEDDEGHPLPMSETLYEDKYEISPNTTIRRNAYHSFIRTMYQYKHTYAAGYATEINKQMAIAKLRGYSTVTDMLLHDQQVTKKMYDNQLQVIQQELSPHMRRLAALKQQDYGLERLQFCDLKAPLDPSFQPEVSLPEVQEMVATALAVLGDEYKHIIIEAFQKRWIDYADNIGKQSGAFCASPYQVHPYILITWTGQMRGAFTLAHELGHAAHFHLAGQQQTLENMDVSRYFVEAPSTLNELLLAEHLLKTTTDKRMKRWIINQILDTYYHNFVTHLLEGEFQRRIYGLAESGIPLTTDLFCEQKQETITAFWGNSIEHDDGIGLTWMRQPHYYMGLYPYTYSAGLTVSTAVLEKIKTEGQPAIDRWLGVLKAGGSVNPLELTQKAGVDMTNVDTIKQAVSYVGRLIDQLEKSYEA